MKAWEITVLIIIPVNIAISVATENWLAALGWTTAICGYLALIFGNRESKGDSK